MLNKEKMEIALKGLIELEKRKRELEGKINKLKELLLNNGFEKAEIGKVKITKVTPNPTLQIPYVALEPDDAEAIKDEIVVNLNTVKKALGNAGYKKYASSNAVIRKERKPYIAVKGL